MYIVVLVLSLLIPSLAQASYTTGAVFSNEPQANGSTRLVFRFTGDAGEPAVTREYFINASSTATVLRNWVYSTLAELNLMRTASTLPALQVGQTVPPLAPAGAAAPTAKQVWLNKVDRYLYFLGVGLTGQASADLAALKADIDATYAAGYLP